MSGEPARLDGVDPLVSPVANWAAGGRQSDLQCRHRQHDADADHQDRGGGPENFAVKTDCEADGCNEKPDGDEGERDPSREGERAAAMLARRRPQDDREKREHAGGEDGQQAREEREPQGSESHRAAPSDRLGEQLGDRVAVGVADRTTGLLAALEGDQGALHASAKALHGVLL